MEAEKLKARIASLEEDNTLLRQQLESLQSLQLSNPSCPPHQKLSKSESESSNDDTVLNWKTSILMQGVKTERYNYRKGGKEYRKSEFYKIDIKNTSGSGDISAKKWSAPQFDCYGHGSKLVRAGGSRIYNLANALITQNLDKIPESVQGVLCLKGVSWVDLDDTSKIKKWNSGPHLEYFGFTNQYAALGDNIYALSLCYLSRPVVLNTTKDDDWVACPPANIDNHELLQVSPNVLPDPALKRIILQLTDDNQQSPVVYAWYPEDDPPHWDIITQDISVATWTHNFPTLVDDDVVFFHSPNIFSAFHLKHNKWMKVNLSRSRNWPPHLTSRQIDHMFYVGDSRLCLVYVHRIHQDLEVFYKDPLNFVLGITVFLDFFDIETDKSDPLRINIAHSFTKSITFDNLFCASQFLPLGDD